MIPARLELFVYVHETSLRKASSLSKTMLVKWVNKRRRDDLQASSGKIHVGRPYLDGHQLVMVFQNLTILGF